MHGELRRGPQEWALLVLLAMMWGTSFAFISLGLKTVPPATLVLARLVGATLLLFAVLRMRGIALPRGRDAWARFTLLAFTGNALPFLLISWGMQVVESGLTGIFMATMPLITLVLAHRYVPGERLTPARTLGFVLGFVGIAALLGPESLRAVGGDTENVLRQLAVLGGAVCYAVNSVLARRFGPEPPLVLSVTTLGLAAVMVTPFALAEAPWTASPSATSLAAVAWIAVVPTAAAMLVYFRLIAVAGPTFFALINFLIPPTAVLAGAAMLDERLDTNAYVALVLVTVGLAFGQRPAAGRTTEPLS